MLLLATVVVVIQIGDVANVVIVVIAVAVTCLLTSDDNGDDGDKHDDYYDLSDDDDDGDFSSGSRKMAYIYSVLAFLYSTVWVYCFTHIGMNMQKYERVYLCKRACVC